MNERSEELLSAYVDGELTPDERAEVERWLAESSEARQMVEELRALGSSLQGLVRHKVEPDQTASIVERAAKARAGLSPSISSVGETDQVTNGTGANTNVEKFDLAAGGSLETSKNKVTGKVDINPASGSQSMADAAKVTLGKTDTTPPEHAWRLGRGGLRSVIWPIAALAAALMVMLFNREEPAEGTRQVAVAPPIDGDLSAAGETPLAKRAMGREEEYVNKSKAAGEALDAAGDVARQPRGSNERESTHGRENFSRSDKVAGSELDGNRSMGVARKDGAARSSLADQRSEPVPGGAQWSVLSNSVSNAPAGAGATTDLYALKVNGVVKPVALSYTCEVTPEFANEQRFEKLLGDLQVDWKRNSPDSPILLYQTMPAGPAVNGYAAPSDPSTSAAAATGAMAKEGMPKNSAPPAAMRAPAAQAAKAVADKGQTDGLAVQPKESLKSVAEGSSQAPATEATQSATPDGNTAQLNSPVALADAPGCQSYVVEATPAQVEAIVTELRRENGAVAKVTNAQTPFNPQQYFLLQGQLKGGAPADEAAPVPDAPQTKGAPPAVGDLEKRFVRLKQGRYPAPAAADPLKRAAEPKSADAPHDEPIPLSLGVQKPSEIAPPAVSEKPAMRQESVAQQKASDTRGAASRPAAPKSPVQANQPSRGAISRSRVAEDASKLDERQSKIRDLVDAKGGEGKEADRPVFVFTIQTQVAPNQAPAGQTPAPAAPVPAAPPPLQKARAGEQR